MCNRKGKICGLCDKTKLSRSWHWHTEATSGTCRSAVFVRSKAMEVQVGINALEVWILQYSFNPVSFTSDAEVNPGQLAEFLNT